MTKKVPLLTIDTIPYMSNDQLQLLITRMYRKFHFQAVKHIAMLYTFPPTASNRPIRMTALADTAIEPFISVIIKLRDQLRELDDMATDLTKLIKTS